MAINGGDWLTVREAVELSGYSDEHITRLIRGGNLNACKVSIIWLVDRESLIVYVKKTQAAGKKRGRKSKTAL
jgi:hypothetical protein